TAPAFGELLRASQDADAAAGLSDLLEKRAGEFQFIHNVMLVLAPSLRTQVAELLGVTHVDDAKPRVAFADAKANLSFAALQVDDVQLASSARVEDMLENV